MAGRVVLALDQGTTSSRAILIDRGTIMADGRPDEVIPVYQSSMTPEVVGSH